MNRASALGYGSCGWRVRPQPLEYRPSLLFWYLISGLYRWITNFRMVLVGLVLPILWSRIESTEYLVSRPLLATCSWLRRTAHNSPETPIPWFATPRFEPIPDDSSFFDLPPRAEPCQFSASIRALLGLSVKIFWFFSDSTGPSAVSKPIFESSGLRFF